ncbi:hypothetical protein [robinz microvirus RP_35]|nr:hypothetical protein [robinz microvirus RP_35]
MTTYNEKGQEVPDDTPVALPVRFRRPPTLQEQIQRMVKDQISQGVHDAGGESFEEADDFDCEDEDSVELRSPYEIDESLPRWNDKTARTEALEAAEAKILKRMKNPKKEKDSFFSELFEFFQSRIQQDAGQASEARGRPAGGVPRSPRENPDAQ